jgi:hypothetical protein
VSQLSWPWIAAELTVLPLLALLVAWPMWRREEPMLGNIAGTALIFAAAFGLIWREHIKLDAIVQACLDAGTPCWPEPPAFTRFAIYAFIALFEIFGLFMLSLRVEERRRHRDYAPEWRR